MRFSSEFTLQLPHECRKVRLFLTGESEAHDHVEELHRILQGQQPPIMEVGRRIFDAAEREGLDWAVGAGHPTVDHVRFEESFDLHVVHEIVGVIGRRVASGAARLAEKQLLSSHFRFGRFFRFELAVNTEFRRRRKIQDRLELGHEVDLASPFQDIDALLGGNDRVAVEISRPLFELGKVLDALQCPLRAEQALDIHAAQSGRIDAMAELLRPDVANKVGGGVGVPVGMTIETGDAAARPRGTPVFGLIELLLRKGSQQQPQSLHLLGVEDTVEHFVVVVDRNQPSPRDVTKVGPRGRDRWARETRAESGPADRSRGQNG